MFYITLKFFCNEKSVKSLKQNFKYTKNIIQVHKNKSKAKKPTHPYIMWIEFEWNKLIRILRNDIIIINVKFCQMNKKKFF